VNYNPGGIVNYNHAELFRELQSRRNCFRDPVGIKSVKLYSRRNYSVIFLVSTARGKVYHTIVRKEKEILALSRKMISPFSPKALYVSASGSKIMRPIARGTPAFQICIKEEIVLWEKGKEAL
jgi:hypothetical protein